MSSTIAHGLTGLCIAISKILKNNWNINDIKNIFNKRNIFLMFLCCFFANLPDLDLIPGILIGELAKFHRDFTHSIVFCSFCSFIFSFLIYKKLKINFIVIFILLLLSSFSHLILDISTNKVDVSCGVPLFWPFYIEKVTLPIELYPDISISEFKQIFTIRIFKALIIETIISFSLLFFILTIKKFIYANKN